MALVHGLWPRRVLREGVAVFHALQVGADMVRVLRLLLGPGMGGIALGRRQHQQRLVLHHIAAGLGQQLAHGAGLLGQQHMLHLHGLENAQLGTARHAVALGHAPLHDARGHGGQHCVFGSCLR